ncbi:hypothetical protein H7K38_14255 [Mycobacterium alsense]|uniref:PE-PGRS family protein n=1 Tax=Mycobacterium alsense TaxID=324058 RepID=A0AA41XPL7_9MYCO|nr:hypothetical protein [Mycobacterium alsense]MCV7379813.1 hypothetical protein [Mycobacterium alsense]
MDLAARRPHLSAGIALASAAVIAAGPMTQHLPKLDVTQHLPKVSVTDINLTDAASPMMDLFSGVENELASLASGASAAALPAASTGLPLPIQTWVDTFATAGTNLQTIFNRWSQLPFPVLQQVGANWLSYAGIYVGAYQTAAKNAVNYFTSTKPGNFQPLLQTALTDYQSGNVSGAIAALYTALYNNAFVQMGQPLENITTILANMTHELYNGTNFLFGPASPFLTGVGTFGLFDLPNDIQSGLGTSLQAAFNAWTTGDAVGAVANLINTPGAVANTLLNGINGNGGVLSASPTKLVTPSGLLNWGLNALGPQLSQAIVAPGAVQIVNGNLAQGFKPGGSLAGALQGFANQLQNGWPSLTPVVNDLNAGLTQLLQTIPSVLSNLPSLLGQAGAWLTSNIGLLISNLLKLL